MTTTPTDRRVRKTRDLLHRALMDLAIERGYDRVTVQDILDRADVGRSTFYAHYKNKDDLLVVSSGEHLRQLIAAQLPPDRDAPLLAPVYVMARLAAEHPMIYRFFTSERSGSLPLRALQQIIAEILTERLTGRLEMPDDELATTVTQLSWALVGLLTTLADGDPPLTPIEAYRRFERLVGPGLTSRLR